MLLSHALLLFTHVPNKELNLAYPSKTLAFHFLLQVKYLVLLANTKLT